MKKSIKITCWLFISLLVSLFLNKAIAAECEDNYFARTLEGNREVNICVTRNTLIYSFGKVHSKPEIMFSTLKKNVLYDEGPLEPNSELNVSSVYIPNGNVWYGIVSMLNSNGYNILTVSRGRNLNSSNYYEKAEVLMSYNLDENTIVNELDLSVFTKIKDINQ